MPKGKLTLKQYIAKKIKLLKDFHIKLTSAEYTHFNSLTTEVAVDNYARILIRQKLQ